MKKASLDAILIDFLYKVIDLHDFLRVVSPGHIVFDKLCQNGNFLLTELAEQLSISADARVFLV